METPPIIEENGKKVFIGRDDSNNPPVFERHPNMRFCPKCKRESENDKTQCDYCSSLFDDGKMECPVCHRYFDYLVGENANGGKMGCEMCWKPPVKQERIQHEPIKAVSFD